MNRDREISAWQAGIMLFVLMFSNKILVLPSLLSEQIKMEAFFVPILMFVFEILLFVIFFFLKRKYNNVSFFDLLKSKFGKNFSIVVYVLLAAYFVTKTLLIYNTTYMFLRNLIYRDSGNILFLICVLPVVNYLAFAGLRSLGRTIQIFFPIIFLTTLFCVIVGFFGINSNLLLFQTPAKSVIFTSLKHVGCFGDTAFLFLIMDKIKIKKGQWKVLFILQIISMVFVVLINFVFILSYTYTSFLHPFAIFELMSFVKEYEGLGRIDIISVVLIIILMYFLLSVYLKAILCCTDKICPKVNQNHFIVLYDVIIGIMATAVFFTLGRVIKYGEFVLPYFSIIAFVLLPIVSLILLKRGAKNG